MLAENPDSIPERDRVRMADLLVLTFQPVRFATPNEEQIAVEVRCVHEALQLISQQQWEQAANACRSIPRRSCFSHWALFLKGVAAFHAGNDERMEKSFRDLPSDSVTAKAARAYGQLSDAPRRIPVIPRNTPLPASKSEMVYTMYDQQEATVVEVFQGESELPDQNLPIGSFMVEGLSKVPPATRPVNPAQAAPAVVATCRSCTPSPVPRPSVSRRHDRPWPIGIGLVPSQRRRHPGVCATPPNRHKPRSWQQPRRPTPPRRLRGIEGRMP